MTSPPYPPAAALAAFIREQASWRRSQAKRFPDDQLRNTRSAIALERLALHVEEYREGQSPHLAQLVELGAFSDETFIAGADARRAVARWGFDEDIETNLRTFRDLLQELVAITRRARRTPARERDSEKMATQTIATDSDTLNILWAATRLADRILWHAVKSQEGGRQMTYCDRTLEAGGATQEIRRGAVPFPGCGTCEVALMSTRSNSALGHREHQGNAGRYLDDLFLHARGRSRWVTAHHRALKTLSGQTHPKYHQPVSLSAHDATLLFDAVVAYENAVSGFLAVIALSAVARIANVERIAPGYQPDKLSQLEPPEVDEFIRPIFAASGIPEDFIPWREAFPDYGKEDLLLKETGSANWHSKEHDVMVEVYGTSLSGDSLARILDPFAWDGGAESLRAYLAGQLMQTVRIRDIATSSSGQRLIELEVT